MILQIIREEIDMKKRLVALLLVLVMIIPCAMASAVVYYRVNTSSVRLRYLPNYESKVLDSYRQDWCLTINSTATNKAWVNITFSNGREGYVERSLLARCAAAYTAWVTKDNTGLKHGPGWSFANEGIVNKGDKVSVLSHGRYYDYVRTTGGQTGYLPNDVLSRKKIAPSPSPTPAGDYTAWVVSLGGSVGLRSSASGANSAVFATYPPGTEVTVVEHGTRFDYVIIKGDGNTGYMRTKYISRDKPAPIPDKPVPAPFSPYTTTTKKSGTSSPRLYQGLGLGWSSVKVEEGAEVNVLEKTKDPYWYKVSVDGSTGYMPDKYLN